MPYCIYTDVDVPNEAGNLDHIIPLSLGGSDQFTIWSDSRFNSDMGSQVDGRIANDPFIMLARRNADAKGHAKKSPVPVWKNSSLNGRPVQLTLSSDKIEVWDARDRRTLDESEWAGNELKTTLKIERGPPLKFAAKVALAGAYFVYGDVFRNNFDCQELRAILNVDMRDHEAVERASTSARLMDRWHPDARPGGDAASFRFMCEVTGRTTLIFVPHEDGLSVHIGVVGAYLASIILKGDGTGLPLGREHDLGHVLLMYPGDLERMSLRDLAGFSLDSIGVPLPALPPSTPEP